MQKINIERAIKKAQKRQFKKKAKHVMLRNGAKCNFKKKKQIAKALPAIADKLVKAFQKEKERGNAKSTF